MTGEAARPSIGEAIVFDLYGTLLDFKFLQRRVKLFSAKPEFMDTWRAKQLQYAFTATLMDRYRDFETLTGLALDYAAANDLVALTPQERDELIAGWSELPAFPDVEPALAALRLREVRLAVLSNGTPEAIARGVAHARLQPYFEALLSVDAVRAYKPRPDVYQLAVDHFGLPREHITFVSSNGWDATGAAEFGFSVIWCNRSGAPPETFGALPGRIIASLAELEP